MEFSNFVVAIEEIEVRVEAADTPPIPRGQVGAFELADAAASEIGAKLAAVAPRDFGGAAAEDRAAKGDAVNAIRCDTEAGDEKVEEMPDDTSVAGAELGVGPNAKLVAGLNDGNTGSVAFELNAKLLADVLKVVVPTPSDGPVAALEVAPENCWVAITGRADADAPVSFGMLLSGR